MPMNDQLYHPCQICPRRCGVNRHLGRTGYCRAPAQPQTAKFMTHRWEEPCISGANGSDAVFFSHCNLNCVFCQNHQISQHGDGQAISETALARAFLELQSLGTHNLNLVSPSPYLPSVVESLRLARRDGLTIPVVYNTNAYELPESLSLLNGLVDIYLPDLKFFSPETSAKYCGASDYFENAASAILTMFDQVGPTQIGPDGLMRRGLLIRHLVIPGLVDESKRILDWISRSLPPTVYLSLMAQYYPAYRASEFPEINRRLTQAEYDEIIDCFFEAGLKYGFMQELDSATEDFTPKFGR